MRDESASLHLLPGERLVIFLVRLDQAASTVVVRPPQFLDGLRAAVALLGFHGLVRDEEDGLEDLLPWAGSV